MQLYRPILLASLYLCLHLFIIGGFIIASGQGTMEYHWDLPSRVLRGLIDEMKLPAFSPSNHLVLHPGRSVAALRVAGPFKTYHHYLGGNSLQWQPPESRAIRERAAKQCTVIGQRQGPVARLSIEA